MPTTLIYLARHGESDWNAAGRWQGHADRPLTERGREQARALADRLAEVRIDAIYSSDLRRAWETAAPLAAAHGLEVVRLPELREVDVGSWSGLTREEVAARFPDGYRRWQEYEIGWEHGETYEEMGTRVVGAIRRLADQHPDGRILTVSHGGAIRAVQAAAAGIDISTFRRSRDVSPNAHVSAVQVDGGRLSEAHRHDLD